MSEIINFEWCEKHGFERPGMSVATDSSYCLTKDDKYYLVVYTERTTGDKELFVNNPEYKKKISMEMPKYDYKNDVRNDFTTSDLKHMCELVGLKYPIKEE